MILTGELRKDGAWYAALVDQLSIYSQGRTRAAARAALAATILDHAKDYAPLNGWKVEVTDDGEATLHITSNDPARLIALLLRRQRDFGGMSLADVSKASGAKSRNGWSQYETMRREPSISKLDEMLSVVAPGLVLAIIPRNAQVLPREEVTDYDAEIDRVIADPSAANIEALRTKYAARGRKVKAAG
jgi:transcriptional regulator with XRE-family HTH domain